MITGRDSAVSFVRERLCCSCPPRVLSVIAFEGKDSPDVLFQILRSSSGLLADAADQLLLAGGRLLVMTATPSGPEEIQLLLREARKARDLLGANRVRLVVRKTCLRGKRPESLQEGLDDRVHLHAL